MSDDDAQIVHNLLRAAKAVIGIAEGVPVDVKVTLPFEPNNGQQRGELEISAWTCGACDEIHQTVVFKTSSTLVIVEEDESGEGESGESCRDEA